MRCLTLEEIETSKKFNDIGLPKDWLEKFGFKKIYTKDLTTNINYSPNFIRTRVMNLLTNELIKLPIINFKEYSLKLMIGNFIYLELLKYLPLQQFRRLRLT